MLYSGKTMISGDTWRTGSPAKLTPALVGCAVPGPYTWMMGPLFCRRRSITRVGEENCDLTAAALYQIAFLARVIRDLYWKWTPNIVPLRHITLQVRGVSPGMPNRKVEGMLRVAPTSRHAPNSDKLRIVHERCAFLPRMIIPDLSVRCRGDFRRFSIGFKNWSVPFLPNQDEKTVCERGAVARLAPRRLINPIFTRHEIISC